MSSFVGLVRLMLAHGRPSGRNVGFLETGSPNGTAAIHFPVSAFQWLSGRAEQRRLAQTPSLRVFRASKLNDHGLLRERGESAKIPIIAAPPFLFRAADQRSFISV